MLAIPKLVSELKSDLDSKSYDEVPMCICFQGVLGTKSALWAQIDVLEVGRSIAQYERNTSVNLVHWILLSKKIGHWLNYRWCAWARYYRSQIDLSRIQLDFLNKLKNQFAIDPSHLRRVWDLETRVFDEANPLLSGLFLFGHYFESYSI